MGQHHEHAAERELVRRGYRIVERNWRCGHEEIDRIAWDKDTLVFVEIRSLSRTEHGTPLDTISKEKQRHVVRAAMQYLLEAKHGPRAAVRFDVVSVIAAGPTQAPWIEVVPHAFDTSCLSSRTDGSIV